MSKLQPDWLTDMINEEYEKNNRLPPLRERRNLLTTAKILNLLMVCGSHGIHHLRLANIIRIDRKNLTPHMKRLIKQGLAYRESKLQGKYFLSDKIYKGRGLEGYLYGLNMKTLLRLELGRTLNTLNIEDIEIDVTQIEKTLEAMCNTLGRSLVYGIFMAIESSNSAKASSERKINKNLLASAWISNSMSSAISYYSEVLSNIITKYSSKKKGSKPNGHKLMIFKEVFKKLYPEEFLKLESLGRSEQSVSSKNTYKQDIYDANSLRERRHLL